MQDKPSQPQFELPSLAVTGLVEVTDGPIDFARSRAAGGAAAGPSKPAKQRGRSVNFVNFRRNAQSAAKQRGVRGQRPADRRAKARPEST